MLLCIAAKAAGETG